ncbi:InlB B-repeat-containing protein [Paenibacillus arenilitoris]|uniref:InlB B-repeat-containing protein n=1 Tax=Paenibacillus arenilitoris TaxID=2772299 RepID=A0A927CQ08_9BACL|nr:InlB B-repeat-containing protein [Paenibacillus arenilitoris]MBD2872054.1 InlB B-repeat-containing protein [Paenibacillus arenilitoris]
MNFNWKRIWAVALAIVVAVAALPGLAPGGSRAYAAPSKWEYVGGAGLTENNVNDMSLFVDGGTPYVVYYDDAAGSRGFVKKYNGSGWETVGGGPFSDTWVNNVSLYVHEGTPYVAYADGAVLSKATVKRFNGSTWETVGSAGFSPSSVSGVKLDFDGGTPYVAFRDEANERKASAMRFEGSNWVSVGSAGLTPGWADNISLQADGGITYVAYKDHDTFRPKVMKYEEGSSWQPVGGASISAGSIDYVSLAVHDGSPYVAYYDWSLSRTAVKRFNGSEWEYVGGAPVTSGSNPSLFIDAGTPYLAYSEPANPARGTVVKFDGSGWATVGNAGFTPDAFIGTSLSVYDGTPYVAFRDGSISNRTSVMKLRHVVVYDGNGSTGGAAPTDNNGYDADSTATVLGSGSLVKTGHSFAGWNTAPDGSGASYDAGEAISMGLSGVALYAMWTINSYAVAFDGNGAATGSAPAGGSHLYNASVTVPGNTGNLAKPGHTFAGWNTAANGSGTRYVPGGMLTVGDSNLTLYAEWSAIPYAFAYDGNGATSGTVPAGGSYLYNASVTVQGNIGGLSRTGYTFAGWNTAADGSGTAYAAAEAVTIGESSVTLYAQWTVNVYSVAYDGNGAASGSAPAGGSHDYNTSFAVPGNTGGLSRTGHTFAGWNTAADGSGTAYSAADMFTVGTANVTLYAQWAVNAYSVGYDGNGATSGSAPAGGSHDYNSSVTVQGNTGGLTRTGYTFAGWNTEPDGSGTNYAAADLLTVGASNVTLYAQWTVNAYSVAYDGNGATSGGAPAGSSHDYNTSVAVQGNTGGLARTGHTFAGWNTEADGSGTDYAAADLLTVGASNVTLYAQWTVNRYAVAYDGNGATSGSAPAAGSHDYGASVAVAGNEGSLAREGHTFAGWNTEADGSGTDYADADLLTVGDSDTTLYARWTVNRYRVSFEPNGGIPVSSQTVAYGDTAEKPADPAKTGHTFGGWYADGGLSAEYDFDSAVAGDMTLFANWVVNRYSVGYDGNGADSGIAPEAAAHDYGSVVAVTGNSGELAKTGHTFAGWNTAADGSGTAYAESDTFTMADAEVTLYAQWTINRYALAYDGNGAASGSAPAAESHDYNASATLPGNTGNLAKAGYRFSGWNTAADGSGDRYAPGDAIVIGAENVTLYAQWAAIPASGTGGGAAPGGKVASSDGQLTLPAGLIGELSLQDEIFVAISAGSFDQETKLTIGKAAVAEGRLPERAKLISAVYSVRSSLAQSAKKPAQVALTFDPAMLASGQEPAVYYYDGAAGSWTKIEGGRIDGNRVVVDADPLRAFAVFAADTEPEIFFNDVSGHWAEARIEQAVTAGIVSGYPDGTFRPKQTVTRAEFIVLLMRVLRPEKGQAAELPYSDADTIEAWAAESVAQAVQAGIVSGFEDGSFRPDAEMTRAEMAVMLANALGNPDGESAATRFEDEERIPAWAKGAVNAVSELGIVQGSANRFNPAGKTTRAEAVTVLLNLLDTREQASRIE